MRVGFFCLPLLLRLLSDTPPFPASDGLHLQCGLYDLEGMHLT